MRQFWVKTHRWLGLSSALFLIITGLTGAIISWDHELDAWLNDDLIHVQSESRAGISIFALVKRVEHTYPNLKVTSMPVRVEPAHSVMLGVQPKLDPHTQSLYKLGFNEIFLNPYTGDELGKRDRGAVWPLSKRNFVSFLYKLHFSLHFPEFAGIDRWGVWFLGVVAILWLIDTFVGFYLTLPAHAGLRKHGSTLWQRWQPAWLVRTHAGHYKLNFDIHRAVSLWTWGLLIILALSAVSLNLRREVFLPVVSQVMTLTPTPFDKVKPKSKNEVNLNDIKFEQILITAQQDAKALGWTEPAGWISLFPRYGIYSVSFYYPESDHGVAGGGHKRLLYDQSTLKPLGEYVPWQGTAGDIFVQAQFPMHSGRILGLPGRILISVMGLAVTLLSITGIYIWYRKRRARSMAIKINSNHLTDRF